MKLWSLPNKKSSPEEQAFAKSSGSTSLLFLISHSYLPIKRGRGDFGHMIGLHLAERLY